VNISFDFKEYEKILENTESVSYYGEVCRVIGLTVESIGPHARVGEVCLIYPLKEDANPVEAEVVGFKDNNILLMPYGELSCIGPGSKVVSTNRALTVPVGMGFIGRILDGLGKPMDDKGDIRTVEYYNVDNSPPDPLKRERIREVLPLGIKAIDGLLTCGRGQRIGLFAGSGVGKSTLLGMIARNAKADVNVITLVGERGREVRDFIEKDLKEEGLKKSVLVIATSDRPALVRVRAAMIGTSIAEYFRDKGLNVLFAMMSSFSQISSSGVYECSQLLRLR
jgi:flagellum-specific ATP synthase